MIALPNYYFPSYLLSPSEVTGLAKSPNPEQIVSSLLELYEEFQSPNTEQKFSSILERKKQIEETLKQLPSPKLYQTYAPLIFEPTTYNSQTPRFFLDTDEILQAQTLSPFALSLLQSLELSYIHFNSKLQEAKQKNQQFIEYMHASSKFNIFLKNILYEQQIPQTFTKLEPAFDPNSQIIDSHQARLIDIPF